MNLRKFAAQALTTAFVAGGALTVAASPAMAADASFPLFDANGAQRSSVTWNSSARYAIGCYPSDFTLTIQVRLTDAEGNQQVVPRRVDWAQCNVALAGNAVKVEVSGQIDGFQNEWHVVD